nr:LdpA C-terminal domain-containing domain [Leptolyngbya sp. FACHB-36]
MTYTLAGADCIDVAADPAVISAAKIGLQAAFDVAETLPQLLRQTLTPPWLMVSFNDGEDPHFRKAEFNAAVCPADCARPCERICPAQAIVFDTQVANRSFSGVIRDRCYGCGRCLPVCPIQHISTSSHVSTPDAIAPLVLQAGVDAIEIHTQVGRVEDFRRLWLAIAPWISNLKLVAISCPDGEGLIEYLRTLYDLISPLACPLIWQTDGRPMSGDIGAGTTRAAVKLGQKVLAAKLPGYVQLAGGTNQHTVTKLRSLGLLNCDRFSERLTQSSCIAGIAYGSFARTLLLPILNQLEMLETDNTTSGNPQPQAQSASKACSTSVLGSRPAQSANLEDSPELLSRALDLASSLVSQLKLPNLVPNG